MKHYFQATEDSPYHLSVGAVVYRDDKQILAHHFVKQVRGFVNFYHLMNETVELGETLEDALHRGLKEEYGITGEIVTYLGSYVPNFEEDGFLKEKTVVYFLVKYSGEHPDGRNGPDVESHSELEWHDADFLIEKMQQQRISIREDIDQSRVLERAKKYLTN